MKVNSKNSPGTSKALTSSDNATTYKRLNVIDAPVEGHSVVNKQYLDDNYGSLVDEPGDVRFQLSPVTPTGYLRCNGAEVSKTTYADLYNVIGDSFLPSMRVGSGKPYIHQYDINTTLSRELYTWNVVNSLSASNAYMECVVTKRRAFLLSRYNGSSYSTTCYTAAIGDNGVVGNWGTTTSLPAARSFAQAVIFNNKVYVIGGTNGTPRDTVYTATIDGSGNLSAWTTARALPATVYKAQAVVTKNRLYVIGGLVNNAASALVYFTNIDSSGNLGLWVTGPSLPVTLVEHCATIIRDRLYIFGGSANGTDSSYCWYGRIDSQGAVTEWVGVQSLPETVRLSNVIVTRNRVYLIGGIVGGVASTKVYSSVIGPDGSVENWEIYGDLPVPTYGACSFVTSTGLYVLGGYRSGSVGQRVDCVDTTGGLDDYSGYYGAGVYPTNPNTFMLPNYTHMEVNDKLYAFVKF